MSYEVISKDELVRLKDCEKKLEDAYQEIDRLRLELERLKPKRSSGFDRVVYMREYMRKYRVRQKSKR